MREEYLAQGREREQLLDITLVSLGFTFSLVLVVALRKLQGFLPYGFPKEKYFCLLSFVIIVVHVILSDNILDHID